MSELTNHEVSLFVGEKWYDASVRANVPTMTARLAQEVQESRRLIADLLALHAPYKWREWTYCTECCDQAGAPEAQGWPCPTVRRIEQATQPEEEQ